MDQTLTFAVLTISDSCFQGVKEDLAGPQLKNEIITHFKTSKVFKQMVPDEREQISKVLISWSDKPYDVIFTVGGTGCSPRDVTPEATKDVLDKEVPGIALNIINKSLEITEMAMLSRLVCGIRKKSLIINLPGSTKGALECFKFTLSIIPHAVALIKGDEISVAADHKEIQKTKQICSPSKVKINCAALRQRISPYKMVEVDDAVELVLKECPKSLSCEMLDYREALHRIVAEDIITVDPMPPFRASLRDGYAIRLDGGLEQRNVIDYVAAGDQPNKRPDLANNEAIRISTGAPIPDGADCVVQVEDTTLVESSPDGSKELIISLSENALKDSNIRPIGSDIPANTLVIPKFSKITAGHIGILASIGKTKIKVFKRASIGVISTGNEIVHPSEIIKGGKIRDCNKDAIISLLREQSFDANDCGIVSDNPDSIKEAFCKAFSSNDIVITSGGVSMGEFDFIKKVLVEDFDAVIHFGRVNMRPGKPTTFASLEYNGKVKLVFGLPGNPNSACVTCFLFVIPCLKTFERNTQNKFLSKKVPLNVSTLKVFADEIRPHYVWVYYYIDSNGTPRIGNLPQTQCSSNIQNMLNTNALIKIHPGLKTLQTNHPYPFHIIFK